MEGDVLAQVTQIKWLLVVFVATMVGLLSFLLRLLLSPFRPISRLEAENAALRRQLMVLQCQVRGRVQFTNSVSILSLESADRPKRRK